MNKTKKAYRQGKQDGSRKGFAAAKKRYSNQQKGYKFGVDDVVGLATIGPLYQVGKWFLTS